MVKFHRKKWQDLSSSEFFGLPSLEQNCEAQNCLGAYWIRPCPAGGEKICPSGNPYDCCPVPWHTQNSQIVDHILITFAYTDINIAIGP